MDEYNTSKIIKKYKTLLLTSLSILGGCVFCISFLFKDHTFFLLLLYLIFGTIIKIFLYKKYFNSALTEELNSYKYDALINEAKIFTKHRIEIITSSIMKGDYQKTLNICNKLLEDEKLKKYRYIYLVYIARCYFYINDLENLRATCELFDSYIAEERNADRIKLSYPVFEFFKNYINDDYKACNEYLTKQRNNPKFNKTKIDQLSFEYSLAVIFYKNGDLASAKDTFCKISENAPYLHYSTLSKKYLNVIETNDESLLNETVVIDNDYLLPDDKGALKRYKISRIILCIALFASLILTIVLSLQPDPIVHFQGLDYYSTRSDIIELYGEPDETKEYIFPEGKYYDYYEKNFLGVSGILEVEYLDDNYTVSAVQFIIDSKNFKSDKEYKAAVNKTYKYFDKNISKEYKYDESTDDEIDVTWTFQKYGFSYMIYETQIMPEDGIINNDTLSDGTVFQFNTHRIK